MSDLTPQQERELKAAIMQLSRKIDSLSAAVKRRYVAPRMPANVEEFEAGILAARAEWEAAVAARAAGKSVKVTPFYAPADKKIITF
jgi:hypothetical protein